MRRFWTTSPFFAGQPTQRSAWQVTGWLMRVPTVLYAEEMEASPGSWVAARR